MVYDVNEAAIAELEGEGAVGARSLEEFASKLTTPRAAWVMVPAAFAGATVDELAGHFERGDIIIDGGNSYYRDDLDRAAGARRTASISSTSARAAASSASSAATAS